jgi:uncharacterized surface anchored protein
MRRQNGPGRLQILMISCLLVPSAVSAQSAGSTGTRGSYSLSGYVRDDDSREVLRSAVVELTRMTGDAAAPTVYTGTTGEFEFSGLGAGDYHVTAHLRGYETASTDVTLGGTVLLTIQLSLHKSDPATPVSGDPISAHELTVPFNARDDYDKGIKFLTAAKPDYSRALSQFQRAIKEFSTYYEAYAEMSIAYYHLGQASAAEVALRTSAKLSGNQYPEALLLLAEMLNDQDRFSEAEPVAEQVVTIQESSWRGHFSLARALAGLKRAGEAEVSALKAGELNPNNAQIFLVLGNIHIQQRKYVAVVKDFDNYLRLNPSGPESDAVRATQEQVRKALETTQTHAH